MQLLTGNRPLPGVLFGITHSPEGVPIIREQRVLKVGIGVPKGRGMNVWIEKEGTWALRLARSGDGKPIFTTAAGKTRAEAEALYRKHYPTAAMVAYPQKLGYFTFTKPVLQEDGTEVFEPDFDAIEAHGPTPTEIDIVFLDDNPFDGAYQMWSASQLQCRGDGVTAERVVELGLKGTPEEQAAAKAAKEKNKRVFPIVDECWVSEQCRFSKEYESRGRLQPSPCKPGGDLKFQLANNIRVGGTAYFHTTGFRSISQIFSSLERVKGLTGGRLAGIPLKMLLRPYKTRHNEQTATQYGVSVEFRAQDIESVRRNLMEQAWKFRELARVPRQEVQHYLEAPRPADDEGDDYDDRSAEAPAMVSEFHPERSEEAFEDPAASGERTPSTAESATNAKTAALADKLAKKKRETTPAVPPSEPTPAPARTAAPEAVTQEEDRDDTPEDPEDPRFQRQAGDMI